MLTVEQGSMTDREAYERFCVLRNRCPHDTSCAGNGEHCPCRTYHGERCHYCASRDRVECLEYDE
jgi:hypothetical protein